MAWGTLHYERAAALVAANQRANGRTEEGTIAMTALISMPPKKRVLSLGLRVHEAFCGRQKILLG